MLNIMLEVCVLLLVFPFISTDGLGSVVFVILSQSNKYHAHLAENLKEQILNNSTSLGEPPPVVHISHIDFPHQGGWTIIPLIPKVAELHGHNSTWCIFLQDYTRVNIKRLTLELKKYDSQTEIWLGHSTYNLGYSKVHRRYKLPSSSFEYPVTGAGIAISTTLIKSLVERVRNAERSEQETKGQNHVVVDYAYELSLFIYNEGKGPVITNEGSFCFDFNPTCSIYTTDYFPCKKKVDPKSVLFAATTFAGYHKSRLEIVKSTWARYTKELLLVSDVEDEELGTISLGIPNVTKGFCSKTLALIRYAASIINQTQLYNWLFLVDDDTILSVARTMDILTCYDENDDVALGERYGLNLFSEHGYNYLTGGAGIMLSAPLVIKLSTDKKCFCPTMTSPDDAILGVCFKQMGIDVVHSPSFHQGIPADYSLKRLASQLPVTFHGHWKTDPRNIYRFWFMQADMGFSYSEDDAYESTCCRKI